MAHPTTASDQTFMGTVSNYANSAWETTKSTVSTVGNKIWECGAFACAKLKELVMKVVEFVKPYFNTLVSFVKTNPVLTLGGLVAVGATYYAGANGLHNRVLNCCRAPAQ